MIRVLIVDDEPPARRKVRRGLERDADIGEIREAGSGEEAIAALRDFEPDLVFLDVQMPGIDGFSVLAAAPEPRAFHVIFLTAHERHALRAFDAEALDYLLKPVDPDRFDRALDRAKEQVRLRTAPAARDRTRPFLKRLFVQAHAKEIVLPVERIDWADAARNYVDLHAAGTVYTVRMTLEQLVSQLDPAQFVRVNRSQLVNLDSVKELQPWFHGERLIVLKDGRELTWTRRFRAAQAASSLHQARTSR
jgi:two-component system LytT family response regulator